MLGPSALRTIVSQIATAPSAPLMLPSTSPHVSSVTLISTLAKPSRISLRAFGPSASELRLARLASASALVRRIRWFAQSFGPSAQLLRCESCSQLFLSTRCSGSLRLAGLMFVGFANSHSPSSARKGARRCLGLRPKGVGPSAQG